MDGATKRGNEPLADHLVAGDVVVEAAPRFGLAMRAPSIFTARSWLSAGVAYMLAASVCFTIMGAMVKSLEHIPFTELLLYRVSFTFLLCLLHFRGEDTSPFGSRENRLLLGMRGFCGGLAILIYFYTLQNMHFAQAVMLQNTAPFFTILIAFLWQGEALRWYHAPVYAGAFYGVAMMYEHLILSFDQVFLFGLGAAFLSAVSFNIARKLRGRESATTLVFVIPMFCLPILLAISTRQGWQISTPGEMIGVLTMGLAATFGQLFQTRAYQLERPSKVALFAYATVVGSFLVAYFIFQEPLTSRRLGGAGLIVGSIVFATLAPRWFDSNSPKEALPLGPR